MLHGWQACLCGTSQLTEGVHIAARSYAREPGHVAADECFIILVIVDKDDFAASELLGMLQQQVGCGGLSLCSTSWLKCHHHCWKVQWKMENLLPSLCEAIVGPRKCAADLRGADGICMRNSSCMCLQSHFSKGLSARGRQAWLISKGAVQEQLR